jgi:hypothetical protein
MRRLAIGFAVFFVILSCSSSSKTSNQASAGVVPADLRDVERDGEGLVVTTFGDYPDRSPDWQRAAAVLDLLKAVWKRSKAATPTLPSEPSAAVDQAISDLDVAISAQDQQAATYAANAIGLAVPPLFDYFHSNAPIEIVRLDAVFRQVGLDAHFGDAAAAQQDLASLQTDWDAVKSAVAKRVPTCTRVGGTATVANDIDQSLSAISDALKGADLASTEHESENGATEIDTLELLFDCPPGIAAPKTGLGSACKDGDCDPGQMCDLDNAGGRCAPDPATAKVGTPCTSTVDCGSYERAACNTEAGDNYPGGYCALEPCDDVQVCPPGGTCVALGGETPSCFQSCTADSDCRESDGYVCQLFVTMPPTGFGPSDHACSFPCKRDADCQSPLTCDVVAGKCRP